MSTQTLKARYTHGVLKPIGRFNIPEGQEVTVHVEEPKPLSSIDAESRAWLDADLSSELPPYEWGEEGIPKGKPIRYDLEKGFVVQDE